MTIAVIIPVLNEARCLAHTLAHTEALGFDELIIVDGGSSDESCAIVQSFADKVGARPSSTTGSMRVLTASRGRARQLNAGAAASGCDVLLFLHADTLLPTNARQAVSTALADAACVGGRFEVRFDSSRLPARIVSCLMNLRSRWSGIATGDQALFVRRAAAGARDLAVLFRIHGGEPARLVFLLLHHRSSPFGVRRLVAAVTSRLYAREEAAAPQRSRGAAAGAHSERPPSP